MTDAVLYGYFRSSAAYRVRIALNLKGLSADHRFIHLRKREQTQDAYRKINPAGLVPYWIDDDLELAQSIAIIEYLADKVGRDRFWPKADDARAMARSMVAEMHSSYLPLRRQLPMNIRRRVEDVEIGEDGRADIVRILQLWAEARARFGKGGPFLFGTFCAADVIYAPVVSRFITYGVPVPGFALAYMEAVWEHDWLREWISAAESEDWVIEQFEATPA